MKGIGKSILGLLALCALAASVASFGQMRSVDDYKPNQVIELNVVIDALDAIQEELLDSGICNGHEQIDVWMRPEPEFADNGLLELLYVVADKVQVKRAARVHIDGLVMLADEINFHDRVTRWSTRKAGDDEINEASSSYPIHVQANLPFLLNQRQRQQLEERKYRKQRFMDQP